MPSLQTMRGRLADGAAFMGKWLSQWFWDSFQESKVLNFHENSTGNYRIHWFFDVY